MFMAIQCPDQARQSVNRSERTQLLRGPFDVVLISVPKLVKPPLLTNPILRGNSEHDQEKHADRPCCQSHPFSPAIHQRHATRRSTTDEEVRIAPRPGPLPLALGCPAT